MIRSHGWVTRCGWLLAALVCALPHWVQGAETRREQFVLGDNTERIFIQGIRPMGMGGAFTAVASDENALFYNPAGLARLNYWRFTFPHYLLGTDTESFNNLAFLLNNTDEISQIMSGTFDPEVVNQLSHTRLHLLGEGSLKYIQPNFGFGTWLFSDARMQTGAIMLPEATWNIRAGLIENASFGWGWDIPSFGYFAFGFGFKALQQAKTAEENVNIADLESPEVAIQWGAGVDLGFIYQPTGELSFALVAADLYTRIMQEVQIPNLKLGFAYQPQWLNFEDLDTTLAVDLVELNWQGDNEFKNSPDNAAQINFSKLRVGLEFVLSSLIALRGGLHQGYPTAGISINTSFINIDWAYFGRELGTYPGQSVEWNNRLSIDWHTGAMVKPTPTTTPTITPTVTPTVTPTASPTPRPTPQPTLTGKIPKLHGTFVGFAGTITLVPKIPDQVGEISAWTLEINDERGRRLKHYKGQGMPPQSFVWNGKDAQGRRVSSEEQYPFQLTVTTDAGQEETVSGRAIIVDTIPKLYTSKNYEIYPDKVYFSIKRPLKKVRGWKLDVFDNANRVIRSYQTKEELFKAFAWDAKDEDGNVVINNTTYRYELSVTDESGNQIVVSDRIRPVTGQVYPSENRMTIKVGDILFDTGKAFLTAEMFDKVIKSAYLIQDAPSSEVSIEGHTDSTGSKKTNMHLSLVRAESARQFLTQEQNVPDYQLSIQGWGPTRPIASNKTASGRQKNRRVEIILRIPQ